MLPVLRQQGYIKRFNSMENEKFGVFIYNYDGDEHLPEFDGYFMTVEEANSYLDDEILSVIADLKEQGIEAYTEIWEADESGAFGDSGEAIFTTWDKDIADKVAEGGDKLYDVDEEGELVYAGKHPSEMSFEELKNALIKKEEEYLKDLKYSNPESGENSLIDLKTVDNYEDLEKWAEHYYSVVSPEQLLASKNIKANRRYPKPLKSGRWMDENGNSYDTLDEAAEAQAYAENYDASEDEIENIKEEILNEITAGKKELESPNDDMPYTVIINCNLSYTVWAKNKEEAREKAMEIELPGAYEEDTFKISKIIEGDQGNKNIKAEKDTHVGGYEYKTVKIDSPEAKKLQNKGYKVVITNPNLGTVQFEIPKTKNVEKN